MDTSAFGLANEAYDMDYKVSCICSIIIKNHIASTLMEVIPKEEVAPIMFALSRIHIPSIEVYCLAFALIVSQSHNVELLILEAQC